MCGAVLQGASTNGGSAYSDFREAGDDRLHKKAKLDIQLDPSLTVGACHHPMLLRCPLFMLACCLLVKFDNAPTLHAARPQMSSRAGQRLNHALLLG